MLEQLTLRTPLTIDATKAQDLNPGPCSNIEYPSVLAHEMMAIEPGEQSSRKLTWKPTAWISHIMRRSHDDRIPLPVWEAWFCSTLGVPIPALLANPRPCACQHFDVFGDHLQTCKHQSAALHTHELFVYRFSSMLRSVGHRIKTHKVTPAAGNERGDIEIDNYVVLPRGEDNLLPPRPLILDFTMTHDRYGRSNAYTNGMLTHRIRSTGAPQPDGALNTAAQVKNRHYKRLYAELPDPVVFLPVAASTSGRINEETLRLLFLHANREASALAGEVPEKSAQFRFVRAACLANLKGSLGLMLAKAAAMRLTIPLDLSTKAFIPLHATTLHSHACFNTSSYNFSCINPSILCLSDT
jgi:hypothetical protein